MAQLKNVFLSVALAASGALQCSTHGFVGELFSNGARATIESMTDNALVQSVAGPVAKAGFLLNGVADFTRGWHNGNAASGRQNPRGVLMRFIDGLTNFAPVSMALFAAQMLDRQSFVGKNLFNTAGQFADSDAVSGGLMKFLVAYGAPAVALSLLQPVVEKAGYYAARGKNYLSDLLFSNKKDKSVLAKIDWDFSFELPWTSSVRHQVNNTVGTAEGKEASESFKKSKNGKKSSVEHIEETATVSGVGGQHAQTQKISAGKNTSVVTHHVERAFADLQEEKGHSTPSTSVTSEDDTLLRQHSTPSLPIAPSVPHLAESLFSTQGSGEKHNRPILSLDKKPQQQHEVFHRASQGKLQRKQGALAHKVLGALLHDVSQKSSKSTFVNQASPAA